MAMESAESCTTRECHELDAQDVAVSQSTCVREEDAGTGCAPALQLQSHQQLRLPSEQQMRQRAAMHAGLHEQPRMEVRHPSDGLTRKCFYDDIEDSDDDPSSVDSYLLSDFVPLRPEQPCNMKGSPALGRNSEDM